MTSSADSFTATLTVIRSASADLARQSAAVRAFDDAALMEAQRAVSSITRSLEAASAVLAGEIVSRSRNESGLAGLARKEGFRTPEALIQHTTGVTSREASILVRAGTMVNDAAALDSAGLDAGAIDISSLDSSEATLINEPWLACLGRAITAGTLSVASAAAIRNGLGAPENGIGARGSDARDADNTQEAENATDRARAASSVDANSLRTAALQLLEVASTLNPDQLYRAARNARDSLDAAGIASREKARQAQRAFRRWRKPDGMTRYTWELDPEGAAFVDDVYDAITSPRRGGPRFLDESERARAEAIERDPRTTDQLASDAMLALFRIAADADHHSGRILGPARPAVRVLVTARDLEKRSGSGRIEGHADPISMETVERIVCGSGTFPIVFDDDGQSLNVGREQRLFTHRQRVALAARDGGCRWPGCERPPSWSEAHHVDQWKRDNGSTDLANGILLCRHHHMLLHDNHWNIRYRGGEYWLIPPPTVELTRAPVPLPTKSAALDALLRSSRHDNHDYHRNHRNHRNHHATAS